MDFVTRPMNKTRALEIIAWSYDPPYDFYNMSDSVGEHQESLSELLDGSYVVVESPMGQVIGFYCLGASAQVPVGHQFGAYSGDKETVIDLGIGMDPLLTGKGFGSTFFAYVLQNVAKRHPQVDLRLTVATFNQRAIKLYRRFGFRDELEFQRGEVYFQTMRRSASDVV